MDYKDLNTFREDMLAGYVAAFENYIMEVPGGVARVTETPGGKVAVMNGGGSGHYPAFCGVVGSGFMDATVVGNIFASPSSQDVYSVAKAIENGSGVFIVGGNYAGDKMNFNTARDRLIAEGIDCRTFFITDDIASAAPEEKEKRRGNVGTFTVFKAAGAAAAMGYSFDEIERVTKKANDRTRTISVGFRGCRMPGSASPMFMVPEGKMEIGQGIHGEPGVAEIDMCSATEIAHLLTDRLMSEVPEGAGKRISVILDGLGATKYEELFVMWGTISAKLKKMGYTIISPQVGELVTSLDMEGIALSVTYLDEELEKCWRYPADTPAFRQGSVSEGAVKRRTVWREKADVVFPKASEGSCRAASAAAAALERMRAAVAEAEAELARIDSVAGDGDHGRGMVKGLTCAVEAAKFAEENHAGLGSLLMAAGKAWAAKAGGTSGILWGTALESAGQVLGNQADEYDTVLVARAAEAGLRKMQEIGKARRGDKTMLDALIPFTESLCASARSGVALETAWRQAAAAAQKAAQDTAGLLPKVGRARPQAERSLGTPDAGAVSMALCMEAALN